MLLPKSVVCFREGYTRETILRDVTAGVVVGIVALPLALAFAIASGVAPERGLFTAIVAGFLISALGGSRVQIGGPTGAFVVIVYGIVEKYGYDGLQVCTIMAGLIVMMLGLARLGTMIKFIPYPVITGFTSGIAIIIFTSQIKDFLGLRMGAVPADFAEKWVAFAESIRTVNWVALIVACGSLAILIAWPRISHVIPSPFVAMVAATVAVQVFDLPVETIGSKFGSVPTMLPVPHLPTIPWGHMKELIAPSITIALLASIESLLAAVVADGMIGTRHKSNMELVAQGVANVASPLFGGIPATGALARTATNIKSGGRTPLAGMMHAVTLLLILVAFGKWAEMIPLAALAAILVMVSYNMSEWRSFRSLMRAPKSDILLLLVTFGLTVFVDLTVAVQVGVVAASLLFMKRMAEVTEVEGVTDQLREDFVEDSRQVSRLMGRETMIGAQTIPQGVEVYEINGPFFFGAAEKIRVVLDEVAKPPKVVILRMRHVPAMDATGLHALEQLAEKCRRSGFRLIISEIRSQPRRTIIRSRRLELFGRHNFFRDLPSALESAARFIEEQKAAG